MTNNRRSAKIKYFSETSLTSGDAVGEAGPNVSTFGGQKIIPRSLTFVFTVLCLGVMFLFTAGPLYASVVLKISASNPSLYSKREVPLKSFLPKGIRPENIIDAGGLEVGYDVKRGQCYVHKTLILDSKGSETFDVTIDDIWLIEEGTLEDYSDKTQALVEELKDTEYTDVSLQLKKEIDEKISGIRKTQIAASVFEVGPTEHISVYENNKDTVTLIELDINDLQQLLLMVKESPPGGGRERMLQLKSKLQRIREAEKRDRILGVNREGEDSCLVEHALDEEAAKIIFDSPQTVSFIVSVENPSSVEAKVVPVKYFLAKEIQGQDILRSGDLKVGFDFERGLYYIFNDEVELAPAQERIFDITLNNKWALDKRKIYSFKIYIECMMRASSRVRGLDSAKKLGEDTLEQVYALLQRKDMTELTENSVVAFRQDGEKMEEIASAVMKMEDLLKQGGISPEQSLLEQEDSCKEAKAMGKSKEDLKRELNLASVLEADKIKLLAGTIFRGKSISLVSTWRIIGYITLFLGMISSVFYFVNIRQRAGTMFDVLTGAFSRAYILDRFREELRIAKGGDSKCSVLVMDIDKFKGVNDTHGHAVGDAILKEFVIAVRRGVRATDLVGRFGGDEFVIILPTSAKDIAKKIADGISRTVEGTAIKVNPKLTLKITTSIGVATFPDDSMTAADLFDKADQALYEVKKRGGNGAETWSGEA